MSKKQIEAEVEALPEEIEEVEESKVESLVSTVKADPKGIAKRVGKKALGALLIGGLGFLVGRATIGNSNDSYGDDNVVDIDTYSEEIE